MYRNSCYMTVHDALVVMKEKWPDENPPNPFTGVTIFDTITVDNVTKNTYDLDAMKLWNIFNQWYVGLAIAKKLPAIGYKYIHNGSVITIADLADKALYVWRFLCDSVNNYYLANVERLKHIIIADIASYDPITNYNMIEYSGSSSKSGTMQSTPGTITNTSKVAPFDDSNQDLQQNTTSQTKSTSGYDGNAGKVQFPYSDSDATNPWKEEMITPEGNSTAISHLKRKGNIGVTTSQQMIASEYELRQYNIVKQFMEDIVKYSLIMDWQS